MMGKRTSQYYTFEISFVTFHSHILFYASRENTHYEIYGIILFLFSSPDPSIGIHPNIQIICYLMLPGFKFYANGNKPDTCASFFQTYIFKFL